MKGKLIGKVIDFDLGMCTLDGTSDWRWPRLIELIEK